MNARSDFGFSPQSRLGLWNIAFQAQNNVSCSCAWCFLETCTGLSLPGVGMPTAAPNVRQIANYVVFCIMLRLVCGVYNSTSFFIRSISCCWRLQIKLNCLVIRRNRSSFSNLSVTLLQHSEPIEWLWTYGINGFKKSASREQYDSKET